MGDLVSDGTYFTCDKCLGILKLSVSSSSSEGDSKKLATTSNFTLNPEPGSQCMLIASSPTPCSPPAVIVSSPGQSAVEIDGSPALGADCELKCAKSGKFAIAVNGQSSAQHDGAESGKELVLAALLSTTPIIVPIEKQRELEKPQRPSTEVREPTAEKPNTRPPPQPSPPPPPKDEGWTLPEKGGAHINGRWYTEHALERMAPNTPEVRARLEQRAIERAQAKGLEFRSAKFGEWWKLNRPDPRGVPPSVVEAEIAQPGSTNLHRVVLNKRGDVVTVIPGGS